MTETEGELTVAQRLGRALDRGLLPAGGPAEAAERLIERLERPARVALLGLPGSGKSAILNLLIGHLVVPETLRLPTIIVQHGDESRMLCTLSDGASQIVPGNDLAEVLSLAPAMVTLEMDLPALRVISLLEVSAGAVEAEQRRAASWASRRADIVVWCTTSYLPKEQSVWESLPDAVKDNSFMLLTKVDLLGSREAAYAMQLRVEQRAGEEFRQIISISAKQARAAMPQGGPVDREMFRESGAAAVISSIKTRVQSGRRADMDTAELLLARHESANEAVTRRFADREMELTIADEVAPDPPEAVLQEDVDSAKEDVLSEPSAVVDERPGVSPDSGALNDQPLDAPDGSISEAASAPSPEEETASPSGTEETDDKKFQSILAALEDGEQAGKTERSPEVELLPETPPSENDADAIVSNDTPGEPRRFSDRIKRMVPRAGGTSAPLVPSRSTWKSKSEIDLPPDPEPPVAKPVEQKRRPRPVVPELQADDVADLSHEAAPIVTELPSGDAATPQSELAQARGVARPSLFGSGMKDADIQPSSALLPDLSSLRLTTEDSQSADANAEEPDELDDTSPQDDVEPAAAQQDQTDAEAERRWAERLGKRSVEPTAVLPTERPTERLPRTRMAATPLAPVVAPSGLVAPERRQSVTPRATVEDRVPRGTSAGPLLSPRAIVSLEPRPVSDAVPRRERTRIAARAVVSQPAPTVSVAPSAGDLGLIDEAIALIFRRSAELERSLDPEAKIPVDTVLEHSRETSEQLSAIVSRGQTEGLERINSDLGQILDVIMLMQLEKGHAPADDALTLLLQLKRELETLRAA